ncbi:hypothetical protein [Sulfurimonas hydrogeniphila]|uniref:hypothetical protein n=1 Tax=Sulfurimonas TaxID=202746 RepID=UPI00125FF37D|nr:hypothetical protein [Sulfurimonas hydrogeniphila]
MKTLIIVPPNGILKKQDFFIDRLVQFLFIKYKWKIILIILKEPSYMTTHKYFDKVLQVDTKDEILSIISKIDYTILISRGWMHAYAFSAEILKNFPNAIITLKDWNFSTREEYKFLFGNDDDFKAIEYIFRYGKKILSHYTEEQAVIWSKIYKVNVDKFIFLPELTLYSNFNEKNTKFSNKLNLVYAGRISSTVLPGEIFPNKSHIYSIKKLTSESITISFLIPKKNLDEMKTKRELFIDFFYEDRFNNNFAILEGKDLDSKKLHGYHFGFFELFIDSKNEMLYKYAVVSKFAFYLEGALPILVHEKFVSMAKIVRDNNIGIVFSNDNFKDFASFLQMHKDQYEVFIENIKNFRKVFSFNNCNFVELLGLDIEK